MKKISLKFVLICLGVLPLLVGALIINLRAVSMINKLTMSEIEAKLHTTVDVAAQHFDEMAESGDGSWVVGEDGVLTIGGVAQVQEDDVRVLRMYILHCLWGTPDTVHPLRIRVVSLL